jgi:formate dehydrogenase subunit beta
MSGELVLARSPDKETLEKAECGGAVTALLKFALESECVDAVLAVKPMDGNRYEGVPALIADPEEVIDTAGALHCVSANIARCLKEYLDGAFDARIAVACKPCDARAIIELAKRSQIEMENLILVGLNCTGTLHPVTAKQMLREEFGIDPDDVIREDIEDGQLTVRLTDGTEIEKDLAELEEKGYGRRENCRRCEISIPRMADIACGKWGTNGRKATFIEVCSQKGADFIEKAIKAGAIQVERPDGAAVDTREGKDRAAKDSARKWQERDFVDLRGMSLKERFTYWTGQFSQCIKCFGCRDACPICYCLDCYLEADRGLVTAGQVPPDITFAMVRIMHVADSCVNCGQCQDACPAEIPLSRLAHMLNRELGAVFKYEPGMDVSAPPPLGTVTEEELGMAGVGISLG